MSSFIALGQDHVKLAGTTNHVPTLLIPGQTCSRSCQAAWRPLSCSSKNSTLYLGMPEYRKNSGAGEQACTCLAHLHQQLHSLHFRHFTVPSLQLVGVEVQ